MMRRFKYWFLWFLTCLGGATFLALMIGAMLWGYLRWQSLNYDKESAEFATQAATFISSDWNKDELTQRATPRLLSTISTPQLSQLFAMLRQLGGMKKFSGCEGTSKANYLLTGDSIITANYVCKAEFDNNVAAITMALMLDSEKGWLIDGINFDSPQFRQADKVPEKDKK